MAIQRFQIVALEGKASAKVLKGSSPFLPVEIGRLSSKANAAAVKLPRQSLNERFTGKFFLPTRITPMTGGTGVGMEPGMMMLTGGGDAGARAGGSGSGGGALPDELGMGRRFDVGGAVSDFAGSGGCEGFTGIARTICQGIAAISGRKGMAMMAGAEMMQEAVGAGGKKCAPGTIRIRGVCVSPGDVFPGGDPFVTRAGGEALIGGFGLPAIRPVIVGSVTANDGSTRPIRRCPSRFVLGGDNLCYPKALLPRRSRLRKHRPPPRPPMSGTDAKALRRIGALQNRVKELAKDAGLKLGGRTKRRAT